jgi:ATP-binding cassette subfamily B protein
MDCGPAALAALCAGFGVPASYGRLREACQTGVDGTSIDALEDVANVLGLDAEQVMVPVDRLLEPSAAALPAIVVSRLPNGFLHFVVVWRTHGRLVQVMDPAVGRRFRARSQLVADCYQHTMAVPAAAWRDVASADGAMRELQARLRTLGVADPDALVEQAVADPGWQRLAHLDATARLVTTVVADHDLKPGPESAALVDHLLADPGRVADPWWPVIATEPSGDAVEQVAMRGAVIVRASVSASGHTGAPSPAAAAELEAARRERRPRPVRDLVGLLPRSTVRQMAAVAAGTVLAAAGLVAEAGLLAAIFDRLVTGRLGTGLVAGVVAVGLGLLVLGAALTSGELRLGRTLEHTLRLRIADKLARLPDGYLHSRPTSDMAERSHSLHRLRLLPEVGGQALGAGAGLAFTAAGLVWLDPASTAPALVGAVAACAVPLAFNPLLAERDLRLRTHHGALGQMGLDALLGAVPIRAQRGQRAVTRAHDELLDEWRRSGRSLVRAAVTADATQAVITAVVVGWLLAGFLSRAEDPGRSLLFVYWALLLPVLGYDLALALRRWPPLRTVILRLLEPLAASEESPADIDTAPAHPEPVDDRPEATGIAIDLTGVSVVASGHLVLRDVDLHVPAGAHIAVVGASGAGKSTLLGLLLGWHHAVEGRVLVDGHPLTGAVLTRLRDTTAWVDPAVQLWNRPLADNLRYGAPPDSPPMDDVVAATGLEPVLASLPDGIDTPLGEGGALVSGGEGQRVRLGRALTRREARLVLLDEPFRGLDRTARSALLAEVRGRWPDATLLCATHDVAATASFDRVVVVEDGQVVEDGPPADLAADRTSRYRAMLDAEEAAQAMLFRATGWRHLRITDGRMVEERPV